MEKNKVTVYINGNEYTMKGQESEREMQEIASYVDKKIKDLAHANNKLNPTFAAVLSALNITNELFKLKKDFEQLNKNVQDPIRQLAEMKGSYSSLVNENEKLLEQAGNYSRDLENYSSELKNVREQYENMKNELVGKNEELSKSYREYELMRREKENKQKELERVKIELSESKYKLIDLQNQLLQNQIEFVKTKKELDDYKLNISHSKETGSV